MPKNKFHVLVGFPKCGQVSMNHYLQQMFPGTPPRQEIGWREDAIEIWENTLRNHVKSDLIPVFVIRDPIERIWSAYLYLGLPNIRHFPDYLINRLYQPFGEGNPIMQSNYDKWIKPWEKFRPIVVELEEMKKNINYPKLNTTQEVKYKNETVPEFPDHYRKLCKELLELEYKDSFWEGDYITGVPSREAMEILKPHSPGEIRRNTYRERA